MPSYTSEDERIRDATVAFNILVSAGRNMVAKLVVGGTAPITSGTVVPEITNFQRLFNDTRTIVFDELAAMVQGAWQPAAMALELRNKGLTADGKYGARTSTALALTMWAQSGNKDLISGIGNAVPASPTNFTKYYVANKELFDSCLRDVPVPQGLVQPPPVPQQQPPAQVVQAAEQGATQVVQQQAAAPAPTQVMKFEDQIVAGQGKGKLSFGVILAGILGVLTFGGITVYVLHKKRLI